MNIFDGIEKLINEHGSAAILRNHVALFRDQLTILKEKFSILETENASLKTENQNLKTDNEQLKKKIQIYDKPTHDNLLDNTHVKILSHLLLSNDREHSTSSISRALNLNPQTVKLHIEELKLHKMIKFKRFPSSLYISQEGKQYLIKNKLVS